MDHYMAKYDPLEGDESMASVGEVDGNIQLSHRWRLQWNFRIFILFPWMLASGFALLSLNLYLGRSTPSPLGTYEEGFNTDLSRFTWPVRYPQLFFTLALFLQLTVSNLKLRATVFLSTRSNSQGLCILRRMEPCIVRIEIHQHRGLRTYSCLVNLIQSLMQTGNGCLKVDTFQSRRMTPRKFGGTNIWNT